ncbi:helix-turn-helix domain-containing protein [Cytobacillus solani]|uniref:helix-turn-helix domain-containing protein n=1 Tax=Cytobacillus solani TaxID=1637975 RepID=UPI0011535641|nr:helix-turn-helix domain-containing protein [Cytobacillus solani]
MNNSTIIEYSIERKIGIGRKLNDYRNNQRRFPEALTPSHVQQILKIGRRQTYELLEKPPFHVVKVGRLYKISKKAFFKWFDGE